MGTDISLAIEAKSEDGWHVVPECIDKKGEVDVFDGPGNDRHYAMFAMLADVRNNYEIIPIAAPRGLPGDLSNELAEYIDDWDYGKSYHTLRHLIDYDWEQRSAAYHGTEYSYREIAQGWLEEVVPVMLRNATSGDPDSVRIVFSFDC